MERVVVRQNSRSLHAAGHLPHTVKERRQLEWESLHLLAKLPYQTQSHRVAVQDWTEGQSGMASVKASSLKTWRTADHLVLYLDPDGLARELKLALVRSDTLGQFLWNEWARVRSYQTPDAGSHSGNRTNAERTAAL